MLATTTFSSPSSPAALLGARTVKQASAGQRSCFGNPSRAASYSRSQPLLGGAVQARPGLESARFKGFNLMKDKLAFNLNLVSERALLHLGRPRLYRRCGAPRLRLTSLNAIDAGGEGELRRLTRIS